MKPDTRHQLSAGRRLRLFVRLLGITGLLIGAAAGVFLASAVPNAKLDTLLNAAQGLLGPAAQVGAIGLAGGAALVVLAALLELLNAAPASASQRGLAGFNAIFQVLLAIAILVAVNFYAFEHETDFDVTRARQFTLPPDVVNELGKLTGETTIVVLQQHKTFGRLSEKPDRFDYAAERKVVEKVQDLVDRFRKFGPQFKVVVLDVEQDGYDDKLNKLTKENEKLKNAIQAAPENSIFFASGNNVQRMSFNEFYQLDKSNSRKAGNNLVLQPQGIDAFVKRIVAIQEKRPKVALAVMHEWLTSESTDGQETYSLAGVRKALTEYGFDVTDLVLKKNHRGREDFAGDAAALSLEENNLKKFEEELNTARSRLDTLEGEIERYRGLQARADAVKDKPFAERLVVYKKIASDAFDDRLPPDFDEADEKQLLRVIAKQIALLEPQLTETTKQRDKLEAAVKDLRKQERAIEDIYVTDVKAKLTRLLNDCDLLIIPRMTIINATIGSTLPFKIHEIDTVQADVIKNFMKAGKAVLVCAGPINDPDQNGRPPAFYDDLERILSDRGVKLGNQTILFDSESSAFRAQLAGKSFGGADIPPLSFVPFDVPKGKSPNPLGEVMLATQRSVDQDLKIKPRALRPVSVTREEQQKLPYSAEFVWSSSESWNEQRPFFSVVPVILPDGRQGRGFYIPQFDAASADDPRTPGQEKERRGPFSIGVAFEDFYPASWDSKKDGPIDPHILDLTARATENVLSPERKKSRLAVIGQGGIFAGKTLDAATERLLLNTCNWLVSRQDRLSTATDRPWQFPRVPMDNAVKERWHWGTFIGLPALFVWLGLVVLLIRRVR